MPDKLVAFIAGDALKTGKPFFVTCNCGQKIPLPQPLEFLNCPRCASSIKPIVLEGNPSHVAMGDSKTGPPKPAPVQGFDSTKPKSEGWFKVIDVPADEKDEKGTPGKPELQ
jgi:hypothetical protein